MLQKRGRVLSDAVRLTGGFRINRHGMFGGKRQIAFNGQAQFAAKATKFREADATEFGEALTKVTESEGDVRFLRIDLADKPGTVRIWRKKFHDRRMVLIAIAAVGEQLLDLSVGEA